MSAKLANWIVGIVAPVGLAAGSVVDGVASARTLAAAAGPVELWRETDAGIVRHLAAPGEGEGLPFGYKVSYELGPEGEVDCLGRFGRYRCADGWRMAPLPASG